MSDTDDILERLKADAISWPPNENPLAEFFTSILKANNMKKSEAIKQIDMEESFCYQVFNGLRVCSRDTYIRIAILLAFDLEQTQSLLKTASLPVLYPILKRDAAIVFCIHCNYTLQETQQLLLDLDIPPIK